jgi:hypothetical protein
MAHTFFRTGTVPGSENRLCEGHGPVRTDCKLSPAELQTCPNYIFQLANLDSTSSLH